MTLSRDERRELTELGRGLADDQDLREMTELFGQTPVASPTGRRRIVSLTVGIVVAALALVGACIAGAQGGPAGIAIGTVLALWSALALTVVLVRHRAWLIGWDTGHRRPGRSS